MKTCPDPSNASTVTPFFAAQGVIIAIVAFASNSLLCRVALLDDNIDAAAFSDIRLLAGGATLLVVSKLRSKGASPSHPDWISASALGVFVVLFSFSYVSLAISTGSLVFSGTVQLALFVAAILAGERFHRVALAGYLLGIAGLLWLIVPGVAVTGFSHVLMMVGAGVAWAIYTLRGMRVASPLSSTTGNFIRATPICMVLGLLLHAQMQASTHASATGITLAVLSGSLTSAIGFVVWCSTIHRLPAICVGAVQLLVPPVAALGGVLFLYEQVSTRLVLSSITILIGIALTVSVSSRGRRQQEKASSTDEAFATPEPIRLNGSAWPPIEWPSSWWPARSGCGRPSRWSAACRRHPGR